MARKRATATELAKLLNASEEPIYVLDEEQTVVFCNQACLDWLGTTPGVLLGRRCRYHTSREATEEELLASNLCPPPKVLSGVMVTDVVASPAPGGGLRRRRAQFFPLGTDPDKMFGVLAIVAREDLDQQEPAPPPTEDADAGVLHDQIRRFRGQAAARFRNDRLVGQTPATRRARAQVELAARSAASVLIVGPPGSGRQHVASAIHYGDDPQSAGSLIPLACTILGPELIRSTVSALVAKGPAQATSGRNTLLLNDVDRLPEELQAELARTLAKRPLAFRTIATARVSLARLADKGGYSPELACVLSTIAIDLPPLAERLEDLPLLAQMFLEDVNAQGKKQVGGFTDETLDLLHGYRWPGNLDELAQVVAEAHRTAAGPEIGPHDLPRRIHREADAAAHPRSEEETIQLDEFIAGIERELIERALARARGNKTKAAKLLGLSRPRLYRRLVQLGLEEWGMTSEE